MLLSSFSAGREERSLPAARSCRKPASPGRILIFIVLLLIPSARLAHADIVPGTVSGDPFDAARGLTFVNWDTITDPSNVFRTTGGFEDGHTLMRNGGVGSISFIEFNTASIVSIRGVRLFAHNDGAVNGFRRALSRFRLLADTNGDGTFETLVVDRSININYDLEPDNQAEDPTNLDLTLLAASPVTCQYWRLEVTQGTNVQPYEGARLVEVDALAAEPAAQGTTTRASVNSAGTQGNAQSQSATISADGRFVAFTSWADNLVSDDTNGRWDVFVRDRLTGVTRRVSLSSAGEQANGDSTRAVISADGRFVAFISSANNLVADDTNGLRDVFVRDRRMGTTERVSVNSDEVQGDGDAPLHYESLAISADGRFVAFISAATNLVSGDTNGVHDVFVRDRQAGTTERVSVSSDEGQGNGPSEPQGLAMTPDGRYVAFASNANNLVPGDTWAMDTFVRDRVTGTTELVSRNSQQVKGNSSSSYPAISADGRFVAFASWSDNLVPGDTNGTVDAFVRDRQTGTTSRVSVASSGGQSNGQSWLVAMSADGRAVAFGSFAGNLVDGDTNGMFDFFLHDRQTHATERITVSSDGTQSNNPESASAVPSLSGDGRFVAFVSGASTLVEGDTNGTLDIFVRDRRPQVGPPAADLAVEASASPDTVPPGGQVTYIVTLVNRGPDTAPVDTVVLITPAGAIAAWAETVFIGSTHADGSVNASITGVSCATATAGPELTCQFFAGADPALIAPGRHTLRLVANVSATAVDGPLTSTIRVTSSATEQEAGDESAAATIQVIVPPPPPTPPNVQITRPAVTLTTLASAVTLRGSASDNVAVRRVGWVNDRGSAGTATGSSFGNPSWIARKIPLADGTNTFTVTAYDDEGTPSAPAQIEIIRVPEAEAVTNLLIDGVTVVTGGQLLVEEPALATGGIQFEIDARLPVTTLHVLLNGEALATSRGDGNVFSAAVDLSGLPRNLAPAPPHQLSAVVELSDGTSVVLPVARGTQRLRSIPVRINSPLEPVAAPNENIQSRWTVLPALTAGPLQDLAVDSAGGVWAVAGSPIVLATTDTTEVVGSEIRYVTRLAGSSPGNALWHWDGASWHPVSAAELGLSEPVLFTAIAVDATALWIGTTRGLVQAQLSEATPREIVSASLLTAADGLAGSWVTSIRAAADRLLVAHRGSHFYRLHPSAVKRYWLDGGGVSVRNGTNWTAYPSVRRDDGNWEGVAGFDVVAVAAAAPAGFWAASEAGLSVFDGSFGYHNPATGLPLDSVIALDASDSGELWAAGGSGVALLQNDSWTTFPAGPSGPPSSNVRDVRIDGTGQVFVATSSGVASVDPTTRVWTLHHEGEAGALAVDPGGRVHTAIDSAGQQTVSGFEGSLAVALDSPADGARVATDISTGLATVTLVWNPVPVAQGYEVFLSGALLGRTTATSRAVALRAGDYTWTVRALLSGNMAGSRSTPRSLRVGESRDRGDAEFLLIHRTADGVPRVVDVFREPATTSWQTFIVDPRFQASESQLDLAATADGRLASAPSAGASATLEQYPDPLSPPAPAAYVQGRRLDATSEPGGYITQGSSGGFILYDRVYGASAEITDAIGLTDVAGLANGRVAVLHGATVRIFERREPGGAIAQVREINIGDVFADPYRIAPLPDGGFVVLGLPVSGTHSVIATYDAALTRRSSIRLDGSALDVAADEEGRIFVLSPGAAVYMTRDAGESPAWTLVPVALPPGGSDATAIATYFTPAPRAARVTTPDVPPPDAPPASDTVMRLGSDSFVYAPGGFTGCQIAGPAWILGFLRSDGPITCDSVTAPTRLSGTGLYLDYNPEAYGSLPAGAPSGAAALPLFAGQFTLNLQDGRIEVTGPLALDLPGVGPLAAGRLGVLGMGEYRESTQRKGIGIAAGRTAGTFGSAGKNLEFAQLLLTDVGGAFHQTFGGIEGVLAPFDEGSIGFTDVPLRLRTTGDLMATTTPPTCALRFGQVRAEVLSSGGGAPLFELDLAGLCINPDAVTFGPSSTPFGFVLAVTLNSGSITEWGVEAASAALEIIGLKTFEITGVRAGTQGFHFDSAPGLNLAGIGTVMSDVTLLLPGPNQPGSFSASAAEFGFNNVTGHLDQLKVPFNFFSVPPRAYPTASGGGLLIGTESFPLFQVDIAPGLEFGSDSITLPALELKVRRKPENPETWFSASFAGGQITRDSVTLFDAPPVNIFGANFDFGRVELGANGFFTSQVDVRAPVGPQITLRGFSISSAGTIGITGGGFQKAGLAFDLASRAPCPDGFCFTASFSLAPIIKNARGDVDIMGGSVNLRRFTFDALTLGPLRVKDPLFDFGGENISIGATVGFGRFPDVTGGIVLENGALKDLSLSAVFPVPGYPLYGPLFLQRVSGHLALAGTETEMNANVLLSGGPKLKFAPFVNEPLYLVTLEGAVTVSGLGYFQTNAQIRLLGFPMAQSMAIIGNVYLGEPKQFVGVGMYFEGSILLFGGVLNVEMRAWVYPPLGGLLAPGPQQGTYGGDLRGTLQVPPYVPIIGGVTFGQAGVALRGTFGSETAPATAAFSGSVSIPLCTPPIYYCTGINWCRKCWRTWLGRICTPPYPCGLTGCGWHYACWHLDVGFRIDDTGFHATSLSALGADREAETPGFEGGYRQRNGLTVFTNFKLGGSATPIPVSRTLATASTESTLQSLVTFDVPAGIPQAIIRIDFSNRTGVAHLSLRLPDGRVFTKDNTPSFMAAMAPTPPNPGDMLIFYRHQLHEGDPSDPNDKPLKEAAFVFRGPFELQSVAFTNEEGTPTGEVGEYFAPANIPAGTYEVIVESTGDAGEATVELLLGNQPPRLTHSFLEDLGPDHYRLEWAADDPDGDPVTVRIHLGTDLDRPEFSQPIGDQNGYTQPGGDSSFEFDLRTKEFLEQNITSPLQLFVSIEDAYNERRYLHVATLDPPVSEKAPPQVAGVVLHPREDGTAVDVYWDHVAWAPPASNLVLSRYGVAVDEIGPAGTVGAPLTKTVPVPAGIGVPIVTETVVDGLVPGRRYRVAVSAVAQETIAGAGPPLCPCNPPSPPQPGDTCFNLPVPCGTPTDLVVEHAGTPSAPIVFTAPTGVGNSPPRFLSAPGPVARLGEMYASPIRTEDPDGDTVSLQLCGCKPLESDPAKTSCESPITTCDPPAPAGLQVVGEGNNWVLSYVPAESGVGRHLNALVARDGKGGEAVQQFSLEVVHIGPPIERAVFASEPPGSVVLGETFSYQIEVTGLSSSAVPRFTVAAGPDGMSVAPIAGLVTWVPTPDDLGKHTVTLQVLNAEAGCTGSCTGDVVGTQTFTLQVLRNPLETLAPVLSVTPSVRTIGADTTGAEFAVSNAGQTTSSFSWTATVESGGEWLHILSGGAGEGNGTITLWADANGAMARTGTLLIQAWSSESAVVGSPRRVTVEQAAMPPVLAVSQARLSTHDRRAGQFEVTITNAGAGTLDWSAVVHSGTQWLGLAIPEKNGEGGRVVITYAANPGGPSRSGVVRILSPTARNGSVDIEVSQLFDLFEPNRAAGLETSGAKEGGLVFCDFNDDRWPDALVNTKPNGDEGRSRLFYNDGQGGFIDVTASHAAGLLAQPAPRSVICGDVNNDGWTDFARNSFGHVEIYLNRGPLGDRPWSFGGPDQQPSQIIRLTHGNNLDALEPAPLGLQAEGIAFADHDNDGDLDLVVDDDMGGMWIFPNDAGWFRNAARHGLDGKNIGGYLAVADYDLDGDVDVLSRREGQRNVWTNTGLSGFQANRTMTAVRSGAAESGVAFCDFDRDGDLDVLWGDATGTEIWRNHSGVFAATGEPAGSARVSFTGVAISGVACGDIDNDGDVDLFLASSAGTGFMFLNDTPPGEASALAFHRDNSGVDLAGDGKGVVFGDVDRDGDLDLLVNINGAPNQLWNNFRHESGATDYLSIRALRCLADGRTRDEMGATVRLFESDGVTPAGPVQDVSGGSGLGSQGSSVVHFGLPNGARRAYVVEVRFLSPLPQEESGSAPLVIRRTVVPADLGARQLLEVSSCRP